MLVYRSCDCDGTGELLCTRLARLLIRKLPYQILVQISPFPFISIKVIDPQFKNGTTVTLNCLFLSYLTGLHFIFPRKSSIVNPIYIKLCAQYDLKKYVW